MYLSPSLRGISFAFGGKILDINTMLVPAIPAFLRANSKLVNLSFATPIPFVRNNFFATRSSISNFFNHYL